jgi:hypothetical protein
MDGVVSATTVRPTIPNPEEEGAWTHRR